MPNLLLKSGRCKTQALKRMLLKSFLKTVSLNTMSNAINFWLNRFSILVYMLLSQFWGEGKIKLFFFFFVSSSIVRPVDGMKVNLSVY